MTANTPREQVQINIPKADENEIVTIPKGVLGDIEDNFKRVDGIVYGIVIVILVTLCALIISL